jgi:ABC-2 type transport system ATP-binding protein
MTEPLRDESIRLRDVSKFYGEVLGVNRVTLDLPPGITGLVGPNGCGKSTLMNLLTGLLKPSQGALSVLGIPPDDPERLFRLVGYCSQTDAFPAGVTGRELIRSYLRVHGFGADDARALADKAIAAVDMLDAADRRVSGYSKGMRQRIKLAQALAHRPRVLVLDEPLNGLDPMARSQVIGLFRDFAAEGLHLLISSHILHEVDVLADRVVLMNGGYVVAEGDIRGVREEMVQHPIKVLVRCDDPRRLVARLFEVDGVVEARLHDDERGVVVSTRDADRFHLRLNEIVVGEKLAVEAVAPADDDVQAVYEYLIGGQGGDA